MLNIRRAEVSDIEVLTELRLALFRELNESSEREDSGHLRIATHGYFVKMLPTDEFVAWIADSDNIIVGTSGLVFFKRPPYQGNLEGIETYMLNIYTLPAWRGKGIATALVNKTIDFLKTTGSKRIWLHTSKFGKHIYEKAGFLSTTSEMELFL